MDYSSYQQVTGVIQEIRRGNSCCDLLISIRTDNETVNFMVSGDTKIVDNTRLRRGMRVAAFYDANLPAPDHTPEDRCPVSFCISAGQVEEGHSAHDQRRTWRNQSIELQLPDSLSADKMEERNPDQQSSYGKFFSPY